MALSFVFVAALLSQSQAKTPNFLVIIMDDAHYTQSWNHSSPPGNDLATQTMHYYDIPTPHIQEMLNDGGVIFPRSYAGGPKCSPSRLSLLTGRFPSRSEFAIRTGTRMGNLKWGTTVSGPSSAIYGADTVNNIYSALKHDGNNPYYTGMVGKWHLMSDNIADDVLGCHTLHDVPDKSLYEECTALMKSQGFDYVDAWYFSNVPNPPVTYSHNPEWIISNAKKAINAGRESGKPWFLYVALTLNHEPSAVDALSRSFLESPKGQLTGSDIPSDSGMRARSKILADVNALDIRKQDQKEEFAGTMWNDEAIGALLSHLKDIGEYDQTFIVVQSDHGPAKGLLFEQGSRIPQFVRFPPLFNPQNDRNTPFIMPNDFITSNVDLAAVFFELAQITPPGGYVLDGKDWSKDAASIISGGQSSGCCTERFMDIDNSHSIITAHYQYIWRALLNPLSSKYDLDDYADGKDMEQVYDLNADPNEQTNIIKDGLTDVTLKNRFCDFQESMYRYQENVACVDVNDCTYPKRTYCAPTASPTTSPTIAMCCTANVAMSLAMQSCEEVMTDYDDLMVQETKCSNAKTTGIDEATGRHVCKWVPCAQVGTCVEADGFFEDDGRRSGGKRNKQSRSSRTKNKESKRAPKPTKAVSVPLEGCGQHLSDDHCVKECVWKSGYPSNEDAEYFVNRLAPEVQSMDYYMNAAYLSLALLLVYFVYRQFVQKKSKSVESVIESTPLLIEVEA